MGLGEPLQLHSHLLVHQIHLPNIPQHLPSGVRLGQLARHLPVKLLERLHERRRDGLPRRRAPVLQGSRHQAVHLHVVRRHVQPSGAGQDRHLALHVHTTQVLSRVRLSEPELRRLSHSLRKWGRRAACVEQIAQGPTEDPLDAVNLVPGLHQAGEGGHDREPGADRGLPHVDPRAGHASLVPLERPSPCALVGGHHVHTTLDEGGVDLSRVVTGRTIHHDPLGSSSLQIRNHLVHRHRHSIRIKILLPVTEADVAREHLLAGGHAPQLDGLAELGLEHLLLLAQLGEESLAHKPSAHQRHMQVAGGPSTSSKQSGLRR
mmetsp:Transcript_27336/g.65911  ORF Transcript_27336/g.65911 Transcript_27336/m.65911 type:complete len:319 (+) Transcript_27336:296-1252(+)